eukprot:SAG22_NODE_316_length_12517_cov_75.265180_6_plen_101_part_00
MDACPASARGVGLGRLVGGRRGAGAVAAWLAPPHVVNGGSGQGASCVLCCPRGPTHDAPAAARARAWQGRAGRPAAEGRDAGAAAVTVGRKHHGGGVAHH